jgi:two-component SAPR family response regulator
MNIIIIDTDDSMQALLGKHIRELQPDANIKFFSEIEKALEFIGRNIVDIAIINTNLQKYSGISLAQDLIEIKGNLNIVFIADDSKYIKEAFDIHASGYILKPPTLENISNCFANLRFLPLSKQLLVKTFGKFQVFKNGEQVKFNRSKSKELFAYLIAKGGTSCTINELVVNLLEEKSIQSVSADYMRKIISDLKKTLSAIGEEDAIIKKHNLIAINQNSVECNYFCLLNGCYNSIKSFANNFLLEYGWAEDINTALMSTQKVILSKNPK